MKRIFKILAIFGAAVLCIICAETMAFAEDVYDDCADFSRVIDMSEGLVLDVVTEENMYAFNDGTHIIRVTSDAEYLEYEVDSGGYFVFNTAFSPNETISHFSFEYSTDGETWYAVNPITTVDTVEGGKWITVHYSLKKLDSSAKYVKIIFGNVGGTPWSPCIESVELRPHNTNEIGFTDCVSTKYYSATTKLKNLGLINGYSQTQFNPDGDITRAEFSKMIARLLNLDETFNPKALKQVFPDVDSDYWGAGAIYALYGMGIVNGDENGHFNPEDNVTLQEAVKIMVSSLGYTVVANEKGGYPFGFMTEASRLKLLDGVDELGYEDKLCRGDAAILMDNSLDVEVISQTTFGSGQNRYEFDGDTILNKYHGIYEKVGEITDVGYASVFAEGQATEDRFVIDDVVCKIGDCDVLPYLGTNVTAYVQEDNNKDYTALYIEQSENTKITLIDYNSFDRLEGNSIYYESDNGREQRVTLNDNTKIIYNYKYKTRVGLVSDIDFSCGFIKIIANNSSTADYVIVYDYYTNIVSGGARIGGTFSDRNKGGVNLNLDSADMIMLQNDGDALEYSPDYMLNQNDVVCAAISEDGKIIDIRISVDTAYGAVTSVNAAEGECVINGKAYKTSEYFKNSGAVIEPTSGNVTAYLDINNNIVYCSNTGRSESYGYLRRVSSQSDVFNSSVDLQIITETGKAEELTATSKTALNGSTSALSSISNLSPQLVKFTLRGDGTLAAIDTATDCYGAVNTDIFTMNFASDSAKYYDTINIFASKYQLSSDTKVFLIPEDDSDIKKYEVTDLTALISDTAYNVQLYDLNDSYKVGAAVIKKAAGSDEVRSNSPICVVINSGTYINDEGERCLSLRVYEGGTERELLFDTDGAIDRTNGWLSGYTNRNTQNGANPFSPGEVIQYAEKDGKCVAFRTLLSRDIIEEDGYFERNLSDYGTLSEENYYSELYTSYGVVESKLSDKILICGDMVQGYIRTVPLNGAIYVYDRRSKKLIIGDSTDIEQGTSVFVQMNFGTTNLIIAIRN